ncbi:hypothetical protein DFP93_103306 [Aneurinibacillus soli]|uniref:Uncharacterized protein n=1 Tax=Aneurinibacillus soli TaxID=1500254 RepID=A0A0U5AYN9_9BACL|nr:hypothetical protein [Aneurinibacillus soli]PYE63093.1 hypothetical protein DFP93_103306 [Aneurinibacillus soli]BAU28849.1 hypothetical protein CB4_03026 [Aneurinibacillus soli]
MKFRAMPIFLSVVVSSVLLFGGWYVFQNQFVKKPIIEELSAMKGVKVGHITVGRDAVKLDMVFSDPDKFAEQYKAVQKIVKEQTNGKKADIELNGENSALKNVWQQYEFSIAEAMDLHTYSRIPSVLTAMKQQHNLKNASSYMDDQNVYIYLNNGKQSYYTVLPRYKEVIRNNG